MRVRRGLLFWGLFLIPLGGVTLLVRATGGAAIVALLIDGRAANLTLNPEGGCR
jgi:hypothetical protein